MKIFIVEDDEKIAGVLSKELENWGYETFMVKDFSKILDEFKIIGPQLVLMDIALPFFNGYYWCQEIRKISNLPIIFISSKSENIDIVMAMSQGADDYITKPLSLDVTIAKIQAILRRSYQFVNELNYLSFNKVNLYLLESKLECEGEEVSLTKTELLIMEALFRGQGQIVAREKIMDKCWQTGDFIDDNTLAVNMTRLRKKLDSIGIKGLIETKKGQGYALSSICLGG